MHLKIRPLYGYCCFLLTLLAVLPAKAQNYWSSPRNVQKVDTQGSAQPKPASKIDPSRDLKRFEQKNNIKKVEGAPGQNAVVSPKGNAADTIVVPPPAPDLPIAAKRRATPEGEWSLQDAIRFALEHNISIKQNELNERLAALTLKQSQLAQLPSANISPTYGLSHGRSIDPTSNQFVEGSYRFISAGGSSDVLLFGWFKQRNTIAKNKLLWEAAQADVDQLKNDVSLNVATGFLRVLMTREQIRVSAKQVNLSEEQLAQTRSFAKAGRLPELNVAQLEAQLASDSSGLISAIADHNAAILDIKALLNLDFDRSFVATIPDLPMEDRIALQSLNPEYIYEQAVLNYAAVRSSDLKLQAAQKNLDATKSALYPQLTMNGQIGSNWTSTYQQISGYKIGDLTPTGSSVFVGGTQYSVVQPLVVPLLDHVDLGKQLSNNFRQTVSATLNIPLFNGWQSQYNMHQARINHQTKELDKYQTELKLKQDVYKAHNDAVNAIQKYYAAARSQDAAQRAFEFAEKRYQMGLTNTIEYLTTQNNLYKADASALNAKYDLIFKLKVIDYYLGKELKL